MTRLYRTLLAMTAVAAARRPLLHLLRALLPDASVAPVLWCVAMMVASVLLFGLPACWLRPWQSERMQRPVNEAPWWCAALLMSVAAAFALPWLNEKWAALIGAEMKTMPVADGPMALQVLALAIVPSITEEIFFRGAALSGLLAGCRRHTAVLLTTAAFALMHGSPSGLPGQLLIGLMLSLLMLRTGCVALTAAAHAVYNVGILCLPGIPGWGAVLLMAALAGCAVMLCRGMPRMEQPQMKRGERMAAAGMLLTAVASALL